MFKERKRFCNQQNKEQNMNSSTPTISVIVPVYNTQKYIAECIESILSQDFNDFELILVDDGSTDDSGKICDEYSSMDSRIKVYHQANGGVTSARKLGVKVSKGEWISFVDSDDTITRDYLSKLYTSSDGVSIVSAEEKENALISAQEFRKRCIYVECEVGPCAKIYKKKSFRDNIFNIDNKVTLGEDMLMNIRLSYNSNKVRLINEKIYNYRYRSESASHSCPYSTEYIRTFLKEYLNAISTEERDKFAKGFFKYSFGLLGSCIKTHNYHINNEDKKKNLVTYTEIIKKFNLKSIIVNVNYITKIYILLFCPIMLKTYLKTKNYIINKIE